MLFVCIRVASQSGWLSGKHLENQHRIAVAEEAVTLFDCFGVSGEDQIATACFVWSGEGADEHKKSGAWEMEIREEGIDDFEIVRGIDEDAGATGAGAGAADATGFASDAVLSGSAAFVSPEFDEEHPERNKPESTSGRIKLRI